MIPNSIKPLGGLLAAGLLVIGCTWRTSDLPPKVPQGTSAALILRDAEALRPLTSRFKEIQKIALESDAMMGTQEVSKLVKDIGLEAIQIRWVALTVGSITTPGKIPDVGLAVSFQHDAEKIITGLEPLLKGTNNTEKVFVPTSFVGQDGWMLAPSNQFRHLGFKPCCASLNGEILLLGTNPSSLENLVRLYRDDKDESPSFKDISEADDDILGLRATKIGTTIAKFISTRELDKYSFGFPIENFSKVVTGLDDLIVHLSVDETSLKLFASLKAAKADDAILLRALAQIKLVTGKSKAPALIEESEILKKQSEKFQAVLQSVTIGGEDENVEISARLPIDLLVYLLDEFITDIVRDHQRKTIHSCQVPPTNPNKENHEIQLD